jgi:hypothetical protein
VPLGHRVDRVQKFQGVPSPPNLAQLGKGVRIPSIMSLFAALCLVEIQIIPKRCLGFKPLLSCCRTLNAVGFVLNMMP